MIAVLPDAVEDRPFAPDAKDAYLRWRERKLARAPRRVEDLIVEVRDPRALSDREATELRRICGLANMAVYASRVGGAADKDLVRTLGLQLGLRRLQSNPLADEDGISALEVVAEKSGRGYIPYTNRRLLWHTDGYYNAPAQTIRAFVLHCVRPAAEGGENRLLDPEIAHLLLHDADPAYVRALSMPDAMTIPANTEEGAMRPAQSGPVFSTDAGGALHMRYTARTKSIEWRDDPTTCAAVQALAGILASDSPFIFALRLEAGQGLVCNNVLHDRSAFRDTPGAGRLVYRARYLDRIAA